MTEEVKQFTAEFLKKNLPDIRVGDTVKVHQKIKEGDKERIQVFEGAVIAQKHGKGVSGTFTVRRIISGIGVEKTFPFHSPIIEKIEVVSRGKARRAKLYYLRKRVGKKAKIKKKAYVPETPAEPPQSFEETPLSGPAEAGTQPNPEEIEKEQQ